MTSPRGGALGCSTPTPPSNTHQLDALLEAARWAATWGNRQPVRFVVGVRGDDTFDRLAATLKRGNCVREGRRRSDPGVRRRGRGREDGAVLGRRRGRRDRSADHRGGVALDGRAPDGGVRRRRAPARRSTFPPRSAARGGRRRHARRLRAGSAGDRRARLDPARTAAAGGDVFTGTWGTPLAL